MKFISKQSVMREGGEHANDREMVEGIADILTQVKDPANRRAIAQNMISDFKRENVKYNLQDFLQMAKVKMAEGGDPGDRFKKRIVSKYPGMQTVYGAEGENLNIVKDRDYDAKRYGYGDIEFMFPGQQSVSYENKIDKAAPGYTYENPSPDKYTSVYNPRGANKADIFLDMTHGMRDDKNYEQLLQKFDKSVRDARAGDMQYYYEQDVKKGYTDSQEQWNQNYVDGQLRAQLAPGTIGMFSHGRKDYRKERRHDTPEMQQAALEIRNYLKTGQTQSPEMEGGGQHGGLDRWFAEKWVDVKTGKECGRQEGEKRKGYPACRPSKRVSEDTPKTASELSASEKEKFKRTKTSSERIPYQHRRRDEGGEMQDDMYNMKDGGNVPTNPELWSRAKAAAKAKYDVYPSAYANGFAAKWYKEKGGGWKKAEMGGCMECGGQMAEGGSMEPMDEQAVPQEQQQQGGIDAALNEVANMLMQGEDPESVVKEMMGAGVPQEMAVQLVQEAMGRLQEDDETEEEDTPMSAEEIDEIITPMQGDEPDGNDYKKGGSIKLDPAKKGTFKAQATRMGMSVQEAATYILKNKEEFSPAMVKKANFAKNFAKELGGELAQMKEGGIPPRYKKKGFTKVGVKRKSTSPGKKWMVLAKKGDQYKIVHGGYKGMKDFTQHRNENRRDRFWNRMGGKDSAKARDPFSPLYWHKRFGTWAEGGPFMEGDTVVSQTTSNQIQNLENNAWNRGLATANTLGDPRMMAWALPNKGLLGKVKAAAGLAAGLSGAVLGYEKLFANDKQDSMLYNANTGEQGKTADILEARDQMARRKAMEAQKLNKSYLSPTSGSGLAGMEAEWKDKDVFGPGYLDAGFAYGGEFGVYDGGGEVIPFRDWFVANAMRPDVMRNAANQALLMEMWRKETGQTAEGTPAPPTNNVGPVNTGAVNPAATAAQVSNPLQSNQLFKFIDRGDDVGMQAANNALAGLGMANAVFGQEDLEKEYNRKLREIGNSDARYNSYNPTNPFGNYTLNAGPASNFALVANTPIQDFGTKMAGAKYGGEFAEGGEYYMSDEEIKRILAMGGEIEFLD